MSSDTPSRDGNGEVPIEAGDHLAGRRRRQILVLHGGGYRGLYTACVLEKLEKFTGRPVSSSFDLIAGTSIGGIIALALAEGISARKIRKTIEEHGPRLFPHYGLIGKTGQTIKRVFTAPHSQELLLDTIAAILNVEGRLEELNVNVVVPACDVAGDVLGPLPIIYSNHPRSPRRDATLREVTLATSAAPTYFASYNMPDDPRQLVDGGVIANSPSWIAMTHAIVEYGWSVDHLRMLTIGTTHSARGVVPRDKTKMSFIKKVRHPIKAYKSRSREGFLYWLNKGRILSLLMDGQQRLADRMCENALSPGHFQIVNSIRSAKQDRVASALNQASQDATNTLKKLAAVEAEKSLQNSEILRILNKRVIR